MKYISVKFPFVDNVVTNEFLGMTKITKDSYSSNLILLLLTQVGERYYNPDYGTNLLKYIFEPSDGITTSGVEKEIRDVVGRYIPNLTINSVKFDQGLNDDNMVDDTRISVNVNFTYSDGGFNEDGNLTINF